METKELLPGQSTHEMDAEQSRQWDENHKAIMDCIHKYMQSNFQTPTIAYVAEKTGLSRPTVRKHIRNFSTQPNFEDHTAIYKFMTTSILRQLYSQAMYGEVRAARLYLELMGVIKNNQVVNNNFIMCKQPTLKLDAVEINEEFIENLSPTVRTKLEDVLKEGIDEMKANGFPSPKNENS